MRVLCLLTGLGLLLLVGCLPNPVSVSNDGTIALTLSETGEYGLVQGERQQVYLTNASADFLEKVEGMEKCRMPVISPSGRYVVACSDEELLLHDRKGKKTRVIYRARQGEHDGTLNFPAWSPDEKRIAFFAEGFGPDELPSLKVYDVKRRELEVLARRASPQAAWLPDSRRLLYVSFPAGISEDGGTPFGDLNMINVRTGRQETLARGQIIWLNKIAVFPEGKAILFPCVSWEDVEIEPTGLAVPIVLKKQALPSRGKKVQQREADQAETEDSRQPEETEAKPETLKAESLPTEEVEGEGFVLDEGQPFYPMTCAVTPDGKKIAFVRYIWPQEPAEAVEGPEQEESEEEETELRRGVEFCVAKADGTAIMVVARSEENENAQVVWVGNTRLLCVTDDGVVAVDADGKNALELTDAIKTKFADQFEREEKATEETPQGST
jgi:Tol biopolymer transport system component